MGYDRGGSFPFEFGPNESPFGSKSEGKLSSRSYPIQFERKWKYSFLSVPVQPLSLQDESNPKVSFKTFSDIQIRMFSFKTEENYIRC